MVSEFHRSEKILRRTKAGKIRDLIKSTKKYYDADAEHYEKFYDKGLKKAEPEYRKGYEEVKKTLSAIVRPGMKVIDVGCGVGNWSVIMARKGALVVSADQSENMLKKCAERAIRNGVFERIVPVKTDILRLPFIDGCFDGAVVNWVLSHIEAPKNAGFIGEVARVVKPKGWLVLSDSFWRGQEGGREQTQVREVGKKRIEVYKYYYEPDELRALVKRNFGPVESVRTSAYEVVCVARKK